MKYVVCYSGGHSSALAAIETVRRHGAENVILLNHDISPEVEHVDIKRFKEEVATYLGLPIIYANMDGWETVTPLKVSIKKKGFQAKPGQALCTHYLKTLPFYKWLGANFPVPKPIEDDEGNFIFSMCSDCVIVYGFDNTEPHRMHRRREALLAKGYYTEFPLADDTYHIKSTEDIGIKRPSVYEYRTHANCTGCLKAGKQHWYWVFCQYPGIFAEAVEAEALIGHSILRGGYLKDFAVMFQKMQEIGVEPHDTGRPQSFWAQAKRALKEAANETSG